MEAVVNQLEHEQYDWKEHKSSWSDVGALALIVALISIIWVVVRSFPL
jgi:hypothetical protein